MRVAVITKVENNPQGEKLYIETLDDGSGTPRVIQSGLRDYLKPEDLLGKHIILASNLAPRTMRGVESRGMLLAADYKDSNGKDCVEPLEAPWAKAGSQVVFAEQNGEAVIKEKEISADDFFKVKFTVSEKNFSLAGKKLAVEGKDIVTEHTLNGEVH